MKDVVYDKRESPNVLVFREVEKPIPSDNEVLVKIYAVSVNAADYRIGFETSRCSIRNSRCGSNGSGYCYAGFA
jgi:hypothetical protein